MTKRSPRAPIVQAQNMISTKQATELLRREEERKQRAFSEAYKKLCLDHGYELMGVPGFTNDGRVGVMLQVRPITQQQEN